MVMSASAACGPGDTTGPCSVHAISAGGYFTCALLGEGVVKCWGENAYGDLGTSDLDNRGDAPDEMGDHLHPLDLGAGRAATAVVTGFAHGCALMSGGSVKCWGHASVGQLGLGDTEDRGDSPGEMGTALPAVPLGDTKPVQMLAAGADHTCALFEGGKVKCWGFNYSGQLGLGDTLKRGAAAGEMGGALPYVNLGEGVKARQIVAGGSHTCALFTTGKVKCWGDNTNGELGLGDHTSRGKTPGQMGDALPYVDLGAGRTAVQIAAGWDHTCALLDDGAVKCWGHNDFGQLGLGDTESRGNSLSDMGDHLPPVNLGEGLTVVQIAAGVGHTCAVTDVGVKCWGRNDLGQLGLGDTDLRGDEPGEMGDTLPFVDLGEDAHATALTLGATHTCALVGPLGVKCWGDNYSGQLGQGDAKDRGDSPDQMGDELSPVDLGAP
ncbi:MAG: hypothetical protein U0441_04925 [Polyangiaceae bacterium]